MRECVVRMKMPKNCCECQLRQDDYYTGEDFCPFTGVECLSIGRQDNCPIICALPENHGRLVDKDLLMQDLDFLNTFDTPDDGKELSYEDILVTIDDFPTIVPAERSEHERTD